MIHVPAKTRIRVLLGTYFQSHIDMLNELVDGKTVLKSVDEEPADKAEWLRQYRAPQAPC